MTVYVYLRLYYQLFAEREVLFFALLASCPVYDTLETNSFYLYKTRTKMTLRTDEAPQKEGKAEQ